MKSLKFLTVLIFLVMGFQVIGQNLINKNNINKDTLRNQNFFVIEPYYGFPNWWSYVMKVAFQNYTYRDVSIKGFGHVGGKVGYVISPVIGIGADVSYAKVDVNYRVNNSSSRGFNDYYIRISKLRILGRMDFRFSSTADFDPYATIGFGYKSTVLKTNDPSGPTDAYAVSWFPVSGRIGVGCRYYFSDLVGFHAEMGLGGPVILGGVCVKL